MTVAGESGLRASLGVDGDARVGDDLVPGRPSPPHTHPSPAPRAPTVKILFVHKRSLFPPDTGGKIRVLNILKHLALWHDVTFLFNLKPGEDDHVGRIRALGMDVEAVPLREVRRGGPAYYRDVAANLLSPHAFTVARNYDPALRARAAELVSGGGFDLIVCDTPQMARHVVGLGGPAKVLFQHNVEAQILGRHAAADAWPRSLYMAGQWRKMRRFERALGPEFDAVIAVSEQDRRTFEREYGWGHVHAVDTAVDSEYFRPPGGAAEDPGRVVFVGSMDWMPNQDGVKFFARQAWPRILGARPGARFQVVGRNAPADIRALGQLEGVEVTGTVPDVRPYLAGAAVVVVPLLVGGGTRIKIFEAMAMGKAVVSTTIGAEGLPVEPGEHLILADDPEDLAAAVVGLMGDPGRRAALGAAARRLVVDRFGTEPIARQFERICRLAVERRAGPAGAEGPGGGVDIEARAGAGS